MPTNILMPALSPTMTEGKIAKWIKNEGETVKAGDVVAEIETDKATMEVEAVDEGKIAKILVSAGTEGVNVNTPIAVLLEEGETDADLSEFMANDNRSPESVKDEPLSVGAPSVGSVPTTQITTTQMSYNTRIFASPLAKRIAASRGLDLTQVKGTGPKGRIVKSDVDKAHSGTTMVTGGIAQRPQALAPNARQLADMLGMAYITEPNSKMRSIIASRLLESKQTVPHFYLTVECRIDALLSARKRVNEEAEGEYKLSVNDFVIKACALALKKIPQANAAWTDEAILKYSHADISVAVATPTGLITPIVKEAENKSLAFISNEIKDLAKRARDGKLAPHEFQGGTFSVSNLGMYGITEFSAIINPPQACILAVGAGVEKPVINNGRIEVGTTMKVTLSCDHRVVDGAVGAKFLQVFQNYIENPVLLFV